MGHVSLAATPKVVTEILDTLTYIKMFRANLLDFHYEQSLLKSIIRAANLKASN